MLCYFVNAIITCIKVKKAPQANFISFWSSQSSSKHQKHEQSSFFWSILKPFKSKKFANGFQLGTILVCPLQQNRQKLWPSFYLLTFSQKVWACKQLLHCFVLMSIDNVNTIIIQFIAADSLFTLETKPQLNLM